MSCQPEKFVVEELAENAAVQVAAPLTVGSLFAGIGGLDLGLERAGLRTAFQVEYDPFCQSVLAAHWPDVPRFGDIKGVRGADLPHVDVLAGGLEKRANLNS